MFSTFYCNVHNECILLLQHQGMPLIKLRVVVYSLIVSRIGYALPAWGGLVSAELHCKIDAMFKRLKRYGYTTDYLTLSLVRPVRQGRL